MRIAVLNESKNSLEDLGIDLSALPEGDCAEVYDDAAGILSAAQSGLKLEVLVWIIPELSPLQQKMLDELLKVHPGMQVIFISSFTPVLLSGMTQTSLYFVSLQNASQYFHEAIEMALRRLESKSPSVLSISWNKIRYFIPFADILYCERVHRITLIHTAKETFRTTMKLAQLEEDFPPFFYSCHKSYIVNLGYVQQVSQTEIRLKDGTVIPVSRSKTAEFARVYEDFLACRR